ncbi:hypothetical protein D9M71_599640 [compost metagenome]
MTNPGSGFGGQQVTARRFKEIENGLVLPRRCVRHVDHHISTIHRFGQAFAGDAVHARAGAGGERIMAALAQGVHKFRSDEAGASDDDDLHDFSPLVDCNHCVGVERVPARTRQVLAPGLGLPWRVLGFMSKAIDVRPAALAADGAAGVELPYHLPQLPTASRLGHGVEGASPGDAQFAIHV